MAKNETSSKFCWDFMKCPVNIKVSCRAHILNSCEDCWFHFDLNEGGPNVFKKGGCLKCPWFQINNPY